MNLGGFCTAMDLFVQYCRIYLLLHVVITQFWEATTDMHCHCTNKIMMDTLELHGWESVSILRDASVCSNLKPVLKRVYENGGDVKLFDTLNGVVPLAVIGTEKVTTYFVLLSNGTSDVLAKANKLGLFGTHKWVIFSNKNTDLMEIRNVQPQLEIFIESTILIFSLDDCEASVRSIYRVGPKATEYVVEHGGRWVYGNGFHQPDLSRNSLSRRSDFRGYPMNGIGVKVFPVFTTYKDNGKISGFVGDIITLLQKAHNFSLSYRILEGYAYGKVIGRTEENKWNGMVGELQNKRVDFTISELSITRERSQIVSYTQPIHIVSRKLYVATREDTRKKLLTYTTPIGFKLSMATLLMLAILVVVMFVTSTIFRMFTGVESNSDQFTIGIFSWFMVSALVQQGSTILPTNISTRMVFWYGYILSLVIYASYSATLMAHLAVVKPVSLPFKDFYGLVKQSNWDAGNVKDDLFEVVASQTCAAETVKEECRILDEVWKKIILKDPANLVSTYTEGIQRTMERSYVFIGVDVTTNNYIKQLPLEQACAIKELPTSYITGGIAVGMQYQSPFLPSFDNSLQKMKEMGLMQKLVRKWLKTGLSCESNQLSSADIVDTASLFIVLLIGIAFSIMIINGEILVTKLTKDKSGLVKKFVKDFDLDNIRSKLY